MYDVTNFDMQSVEGAQERGMYYIDVNTSINQLFDKPLAVNADDGRVLACAVFKEVKYDSGDDTSGAEDIQKDDITLSLELLSAPLLLGF
jgi:hypothetical protein